MTAKEARELKKQALKAISGRHKEEYDLICNAITSQINEDATKDYIDVDTLSPTVKAILTDREHGYDVEYNSNHRGESYYRVSWSD